MFPATLHQISNQDKKHIVAAKLITLPKQTYPLQLADLSFSK
ncbi:MAG TPA: hypothetical protein VFV68_02890 [Agriterribacter sp.]|nr:hypothetical protein [Agriterribacter sp.]